MVRCEECDGRAHLPSAPATGMVPPKPFWFLWATRAARRPLLCVTAPPSPPARVPPPPPRLQGMSVVEAHNALLKNGPMYQLLFWIGMFELIITIPAFVATQNGERAPGDFNFGMGFAPKDPEKFKLKQIAGALFLRDPSHANL